VNVASVTARSPSSVPEPNTAILLGSGLIGVAFALRRGVHGRSKLPQQHPRLACGLDRTGTANPLKSVRLAG
jgi:hypothetical protein